MKDEPSVTEALRSALAALATRMHDTIRDADGSISKRTCFEWQREVRRIEAALAAVAVPPVSDPIRQLVDQWRETQPDDEGLLSAYDDARRRCADQLDAALRGVPPAQPEPLRCDCGAVLTECFDCAVADYQAAHPECPTCCLTPEAMDALTRARREGVPPVQEWQDIETAPKDGTTILAWDTIEHELMFWHEGAWRNNDLDDVPVQPTHWVPRGLPDPPRGFDLFRDDFTGACSSMEERRVSTSEGAGSSPAAHTTPVPPAQEQENGGIRSDCWYCMKPGYLYRHSGDYNISMCDACRDVGSVSVDPSATDPAASSAPSTPSDLGHKSGVPPVQEQEWRDIETAPKDGTPVLIGWLDGESWTERRAWWMRQFDSDVYDEANDAVTWISAWTDNAVASFGYEETHAYNPTHWTPLPHPPAAPSVSVEPSTTDPVPSGPSASERKP